MIFRAPIDGPITSGFGPRSAPVPGASTFHAGIDIGADMNDAVRAPLDGIIEKIFTDAKGGKQMIMRHAGGWRTGYADLNKWNMRQGASIKQGQIIAYAGKSGPSTGPHLHFSLTDPAGTKVDPTRYFGRELPGSDQDLPGYRRPRNLVAPVLILVLSLMIFIALYRIRSQQKLLTT